MNNSSIIQRCLLGLGLAAFVAFLLVVLLGIRITLTVDRELVGSDEVAVEMIMSGAPVDQIEAEIDKAPHVLNDYIYVDLSALGWAIEKGRPDVAAMLLRKGADVNPARDASSGFDPLNYAILCGEPQIVRLLLDRGANTKALGHDGVPALERGLQAEDPRVRAVFEEWVNRNGSPLRKVDEGDVADRQPDATR